MKSKHLRLLAKTPLTLQYNCPENKVYHYKHVTTKYYV